MRMLTMRKLRPEILAATLLLAACGQKGNLYLPEQTKTPVPVTTPAATPADADRDADAKKTSPTAKP
jgi:predicted small lipoprotein YifL